MSDNDPYAKYAVSNSEPSSQPDSKIDADPYAKYAKTYPTANKDYRASIQFGTVPNGNMQPQQPPVERKSLSYAGGLSQPLSQNTNLEQPARYAAVPGAAGLGAAQGVYNTAKSVGDLPVSLINKLAGTNFNIPSPNLQQYAAQDPYSRAAFSGGELAGEVAGGGGVYSGLGKALKLGAETPAIQRMLQGGATGYATGEESPGGRGVGAALGAAGVGASQLTNKSLANKLSSMYKNVDQKYTAGFQDLFENTPNEIKKIKDYGVISPDKLRLKSVKADLRSPEKQIIKRYQKNPTFENAHFAQSQLGKYVADLEKSFDRDPGSFKKVNELNAASSAYNSLKSGIDNALKGIDEMSGSGNYSDQYRALKSGYERDVVPFFGNKLEAYADNRAYPSEVMKRVFKDKPFMEFERKGNRIIPGPGKNISELQLRSMLNKIFGNKLVKYGVPIAAYPAYKTFKG